MNNYIAKAYIKVDSLVKRKDIVNQLAKVGYKNMNDLEGSIVYTRVFNEPFVLVTYDSFATYNKRYPDYGYIDCNAYAEDDESAIQLFLELAKMRDDTDKDQWFITEEEQRWINQDMVIPIGSFEQCFIDKRVGVKARRATPIELAINWKQIHNYGSK